MLTWKKQSQETKSGMQEREDTSGKGGGDVIKQITWNSQRTNIFLKDKFSGT